jgi:hypothetical protein
MRQRIIRNLRNLQKLVPVNRARAVLVELHESFLETMQLGRRDCMSATGFKVRGVKVCMCRATVKVA